MTAVTGLVSVREGRIRDTFNHPLVHGHFVKDKRAFNEITCAFDIIGDTVMALTAFNDPDSSENARNYLTIFGLFQAGSVLLDACKVIASHLGVVFPENQKREAIDLQDIRVRIAGHPHSISKSKRRKRSSSSSGIGRFSLTGIGCTLYYWDHDGESGTESVDFESYAISCLRCASQALKVIQAGLTSLEVKLEQEWSKDPLSAHFRTVGYACEKLSAAGRNGELRLMGWALDTIDKAVEQVRNLDRMSSLYAEDVSLHLEDYDYALSKLRQMISSDLGMNDVAELGFLARNVCHGVRRLEAFCKELDSEFTTSHAIVLRQLESTLDAE